MIVKGLLLVGIVTVFPVLLLLGGPWAWYAAYLVMAHLTG